MDLFNTINRPVRKKKCLSSGSSNEFFSPSERINDRRSFETNQNFLPLNHLSKSEKKEFTTNFEPIKLDIDFLVQQAEGIYQSNRSKMFSQFEYSPPQISTEVKKQNDNGKFSENFNQKENFFLTKNQIQNENENENEYGYENENENENEYENRRGIKFETNLNSNSNYLSCKQRQSLPFSPPVRTKNPIMYDENFDPVIELGVLENTGQNTQNDKYF
ncbi:hypothetical protein M0813_02565 [Anaeramoeba flamelloides]|uniref:Uncharacterized protein n=1 Tax=Anaeramoeba flamelloides TaxID=1746091 RepID=A0ABQ8YDP7_9EUKA|nr:hypothetical protein M0813_02565 [Anaeramoeba flamelloides]